MKKNNILKECIIQAIKNTDDGFASSDIRFHLKAALSKVEKLEEKKERHQKSEVQSNNWVLTQGTMMHPKDAQIAMQNIDKLIEIEKLNLENIKNQRVQNDNDGKFQTFFG